MYLGSFVAAKDQEGLKNLGIKNILNMTEELGNVYPDDFTYLNLPLSDLAESNLSEVFDQGVAFIENSVK